MTGRGEPRPSRKRREPAPRQRPAAQSGTRTSAHSFRYSHLPAIRRPLPARQELVHLLHPRSIYASKLLPCWPSLSPCNEQTRKHVVRFMNGCSAATLCFRGKGCRRYRLVGAESVITVIGTTPVRRPRSDKRVAAVGGSSSAADRSRCGPPPAAPLRGSTRQSFWTASRGWRLPAR